MKQQDVAETLVEDADAIGEDLAFDAQGKRIRRLDRRAKRKPDTAE